LFIKWILTMKQWFVEEQSNKRVTCCCSWFLTKFAVPTLKTVQNSINTSLMTLVEFRSYFFSYRYHFRGYSSCYNISIILYHLPHVLKSNLVFFFNPRINHLWKSFSSRSGPRSCSHVVIWVIWHLSIICCNYIAFLRVDRVR